MSDKPLCPCGHPLKDGLCTLRLLPDGGDSIQINEAPVKFCLNCNYTVAAEAGYDRISQALGLNPGDPWPRCRIFTDKPVLKDLTTGDGMP